MKKWSFAVGGVLIIIGLMLMTIAYNPSEAKNYRKITEVRQQWIVSANLTKGQVIWVEIRQHINWSVGLFDFDDEMYPGFAILYVGVDIIDPYGKSTEFLMVWGLVRENVYAPEIVKRMLTILDINVIKNEGGIDPTPFLVKQGKSSYYSDVGGIVQYNGTYTFTVGKILPKREDPPSVIWIGERLTWIEYPYTYMLPLGLAISGGGTTLTWFSLKKRTLKRRKFVNLKKLKKCYCLNIT